MRARRCCLRQKQPGEHKGVFIEMRQLVRDVNILYVLSVRAGAVISCRGDWREVGATFSAVTSRELRGAETPYLIKWQLGRFGLHGEQVEFNPEPRLRKNVTFALQE